MPTPTFPEARSLVERAYGVSTEPYGAEDAQDFRVFHEPEKITGTATLVSKRNGRIREAFVPQHFDKLEAMERIGDWPT